MIHRPDRIALCALLIMITSLAGCTGGPPRYVALGTTAEPPKNYWRFERRSPGEDAWDTTLRTVQGLAKPLSSDTAPLRLADALVKIGQSAGLPIDVDWGALEEVGVRPDTIIVAGQPFGSARTMLELVLEAAAEATAVGASALTWQERDTGLTVTSRRAWRKSAVVRSYELGDLLLALSWPELEPARLEDEWEIIQILVRETVDREGWEHLPPMVHEGTRLIVTNTPANHRFVTALLWKLREQKAAQVQVDLWMVTGPRGLAGRLGVERGRTLDPPEILKLLEQARQRDGTRVDAVPLVRCVRGEKVSALLENAESPDIAGLQIDVEAEPGDDGDEATVWLRAAHPAIGELRAAQRVTAGQGFIMIRPDSPGSQGAHGTLFLARASVILHRRIETLKCSVQDEHAAHYDLR